MQAVHFSRRMLEQPMFLRQYHMLCLFMYASFILFW